MVQGGGQRVRGTTVFLRNALNPTEEPGLNQVPAFVVFFANHECFVNFYDAAVTTNRLLVIKPMFTHLGTVGTPVNTRLQGYLHVS